MWRDRERQRLASVSAAHSAEVARLRKDFQQRAPYEAVLAGAKVGCGWSLIHGVNRLQNLCTRLGWVGS